MKTKLSQGQLDQILELYNQNLGSRKISKLMDIGRKVVQNAYKQLGLDSKSRKKLRSVCNRTEYKCKKCEIVKLIDQFRKEICKNTGRISYRTYCLDCEKERKRIYNNEYYQDNKEAFKEYKQENSERISEYDKQYRAENKEILSEEANTRRRKRREKDPAFKLREKFSNVINVALKKSGGSKNGESYLKYLSYTMEELKQHLESLFESWMTWKNQGRYDSNLWDDNDSSTWKWQIDHIIPQTDLPYTSMEDENFKKCWSLSNLRPYSAKQNILDGNSRIRHKKAA